MVHMQYLNQNRFFEINSNIVEWDIKSAGISIIQEYKLLPQDKIDKLLSLPKDRRNISIGKIGQSDKDFARILEDKFNEVIDIFIKNNNLDKEYDVLSIKRDAIFTINRQIPNPNIGEFIKFVPKNTYHAYLFLKPYEFYFKSNDDIDVKGLCGDIERRNELLKLHKNGIINFLNEVIKLCERTNMNKRQINKFCSNFVNLYKRKELDFDYYREFNSESMYKYVSMGQTMMVDEIDISLLEKIDITYNYINIILPFINILCL